MDPLEAFAANLRRLRQEAGLTHERLSERSGVDLASIGRIERAERDPGVAPSRDWLGVWTSSPRNS